MRFFRLVIALGALAALPACNLIAGGGGGAETATRNESAPKDGEERPKQEAEGRASSREDEPSRGESRREDRQAESTSGAQDWIVGRWGDPDCQTVVEFQGNGTFAINGSEGQWSLDGDALTMSGAGGEQTYTALRDGGGITLEDNQGNAQQLGPC